MGFTSLPLGVKEAPKEPVIGNFYFAIMIIFDLACYVSMGVRDDLFVIGSY